MSHLLDTKVKINDLEKTIELTKRTFSVCGQIHLVCVRSGKGWI